MEQLHNSDEFYDEIAFFEELLQEYNVESEEYKRMVLAREIALIERLNGFEFKQLISSDEQRQHIKSQILKELLELTIPKNDDDIRIGFGGSKPRNRVRSDRKAIILLGLPASGKSTVAQVMSDMQGAYIIDSDFAKRKFPELTFPNGAFWTHDESDDLVYSEGDGVFATCLKKGYNMVIPKVGARPDSIIEIHETLTSQDYKVSLGLVWLEPQKALFRAIKRYQKSKRYVPILKIITDGTGPLEVYEQLKGTLQLEHHVHLSSDVPFNEPCHIEDMSKNCIWW
ncbi:zeta toxin family protein [Vibrio rotiferianus]|uniref:zeta toxin family protein n=1 Tax=Vibrio rotiferianus TaxID=190895 RepID=UPI0039816306